MVCFKGSISQYFLKNPVKNKKFKVLIKKTDTLNRLTKELIMKKYFLFFNLFLMFFVGGIKLAEAKKKYRYIKREHGVRFLADFPMVIDLTQGFSASADLKGAYTYNWRGRLEFGPYFNVASGIIPMGLKNWGAGLLVEYNLIKNRGKRKLIPSVGLSFGGESLETASLGLAMGGHGSLKVFVGKRTPFTVTLAYKALTPLSQPFTGGLFHHLGLSMGFSYYFDFY